MSITLMRNEIPYLDLATQAQGVHSMAIDETFSVAAAAAGATIQTIANSDDNPSNWDPTTTFSMETLQDDILKASFSINGEGQIGISLRDTTRTGSFSVTLEHNQRGQVDKTCMLIFTFRDKSTTDRKSDSIRGYCTDTEVGIYMRTNAYSGGALFSEVFMQLKRYTITLYVNNATSAPFTVMAAIKQDHVSTLIADKAELFTVPGMQKLKSEIKYAAGPFIASGECILGPLAVEQVSIRNAHFAGTRTVPEGTTLMESFAIAEVADSAEPPVLWTPYTPGTFIQEELAGKFLYYRIQMTTANEDNTPALKGLYFGYQDHGIPERLLVYFSDPLLNRETGERLLVYDALTGGLLGVANAEVASFSTLITDLGFPTFDAAECITHLKTNPDVALSITKVTQKEQSFDIGSICVSTAASVQLTYVGGGEG